MITTATGTRATAAIVPAFDAIFNQITDNVTGIVAARAESARRDGAEVTLETLDRWTVETVDLMLASFRADRDRMVVQARDDIAA
jgi:hypothetical protein